MYVYRLALIRCRTSSLSEPKHCTGILFYESTKQVSLVLFCPQRWCSHIHLMNRGLKTRHPYQSLSFLKVPIIIKPLKQIKAQPNLFPPSASINHTRLPSQWSLKGSGEGWRVPQTVQPECSAWAVKCGKWHTWGVGSPPHNKRRESCCKHSRLAKDRNRAAKLNTEPQQGGGDSGENRFLLAEFTMFD